MARKPAGRQYRQPYGQREHDEAAASGCFALFAIVMLVAVALVVGIICATAREPEAPAYDYAGPDGTLTGVPYDLQNYVVVDHDTGVYYFLVRNSETGDIALCPRLDADGAPWQRPTYERGE